MTALSVMKTRPPFDPQKLESKLEKLRDRLAAAQAESKRIAAKRITTERKLEDLGRQLAELKRDLAAVNGGNDGGGKE
jgi:hypothetical protein